MTAARQAFESPGTATKEGIHAANSAVDARAELKGRGSGGLAAN